MTSEPAATNLAAVAGDLRVPETAIDLETLEGLTRKRLLAICRRIGLKGVSRLRKADLADRLWREIRVSEPVSEVADEATVVDAAVREAPAVTASGSRREDHEPEIPWSYGRDRVTAMAVDPERLFVYWEVADEAIAYARELLGPGGPAAWLNLRVYDTTGRIFDGTNAHSCADHRVAREDRQWFLQIGKPASEAFVELGMKSDEGYFVKIARSNRVEFPRREPVAGAPPRWMTVRVRRRLAKAEWRREEGSESAAPATGFEAPPMASKGPAPPPAAQQAEGAEGASESALGWTELFPTESLTAETRSYEWRGPWSSDTWEAGPWITEEEVPGPVTESFAGDVSIRTLGERTHVVYGPWTVEIRGIGAYRRRAVLDRWEIYRSWVSDEQPRTRPAAARSVKPGGSSELVGASERWLAASEERLGGASEQLYLGASERRFEGAGELGYLGASERRLKGASERRLKGASERRLRGASERRLGGGSETLLGGASEARLAGAGDGGAGEGSYPPIPDPSESQ